MKTENQSSKERVKIGISIKEDTNKIFNEFCEKHGVKKHKLFEHLVDNFMNEKPAG